MSWDCPYWNNEICELNGMACTPGKGRCVLRDRFQIISWDGEKKKDNKLKTDSLKNKSKHT
ncbi:MAG: hypothetical protein JW956_13675 [Calditrichaceae bacterium]|nr:hypothetical protein [Calditrichaceae bacterium]